MKYILFDQNAISVLVSRNKLQSVEFQQGRRLVEHCCGMHASEVLEGVAIEHSDDGVLFIGKKPASEEAGKAERVFCIDLTTCDLLSEKEHPSDFLTILQKTLRTVLKIWEQRPFTSSERINETKAIVFPFAMPDHRRIVIERSNVLERLTKRGVTYPLLAYKYCKEDSHSPDVVDRTVLVKAGEYYRAKYYELQQAIVNAHEENSKGDEKTEQALISQTGRKQVAEEGFAFIPFDMQYEKLTETQKYIVDYQSITSPIRIAGAAGTGKTISLIMRAYRLLTEHKERNEPFSMVFFSHSESTRLRNEQVFSNYPMSKTFLDESSEQRIRFVSLLSFCREFAQVPTNLLLDHDASEAKTAQLMLIGDALQKAKEERVLSTYRPLMSERIKRFFDESLETDFEEKCQLLQHEFSVQIKGRTDCSFEKYNELPSIRNGLHCANEKDKELVFHIFTLYQEALKSINNYDVDDIVLEALSRLNAPVWRRERVEDGYDYIIVDEMHLFNINEQSVFHYLTKDASKRDVPICFALDYSQAIGDRGDNSNDYVENAFGKLEKRRLQTVFRNSPQIAEFCASIAASGTLMFEESFENPYQSAQNCFTEEDEKKCSIPQLYMYQNDEEMLKAVGNHVESIKRSLHCRYCDIAVIPFVPGMDTKEGIHQLSSACNKKIRLLDLNERIDEKCVTVASPYAINGLEFQAVILLGVDEGRLPQTTGTSDISQHFIRYSAYNLLYLSASRAKYSLLILGSNLNGQSSCLEHSVHAGYLQVAQK